MMDVHANSDRPEPLFRPVKKRKFVRRRADTEAEDVQLEAPPPAATDPSPRNQHSFSANDATQTAGIGRIRRPQRARRGGIEFSASSRLVGNERQLAVGPRTDDHEGEKIQAMRDRFTGHTGQTVDVDKHMMNYIESEMAKRYRHVPTDPPDFSMYHANETAGRQPPSELPQREPASLGKLHEIDLGQEAKLRNIARTEAATKRLTTDGEIVTSDQEAAPAPPTKDEKPRRNRKRRNSEDLERDRLVEEVLRESKLDVYDEPDEDDHSDDQAADDKIAEQFRREFLDAIQSRRRVARAKNTKPATKTEAPKGPKLGGSRSARAAMREMQEKSGQK